MRRTTTTQKLNAAITDNLLKLIRAEKYNKITHQTDIISPEIFKESLEFVCESIFLDCIGWHFERKHGTGEYVIECGRMNGDSDFIIIAHLCANDGVSREEIDMILMIEEE